MAKRKTKKRKSGKESGFLSSVLAFLFAGGIISSVITETSNKTKRYLLWAIVIIVIIVGGLFLAAAIADMIARKKSRNGPYDIPSELYKIDNIDGRSFEYWCSRLLINYGFSNVKITPSSNDQGVDILGNLNGSEYAIQCKRYKSKLDNTPVQEVYAGAAYYGCSYAVVMTNSYFTKGAIEVASRIGVRLWDRNELIKMMREINEHSPKKSKKDKRKSFNGDSSTNSWPHDVNSRIIDENYYENLPSVAPINGQLRVACNVLGGTTEKYNPYIDWDADSYMIEIVSPFFLTEDDAEHFKMAITKKYYALAKRNGNVVTAYIHDEYIHGLFDPNRCVYVLDNYCE